MKNNGSNDERFLVKRDLKGSGKPVVSLLNYRDGNETLDLLDLPVYEEELYELVVLGPINGMYVLYGRINGISVLLNPATRDFKALPVSTIPLAPHTSVLTDGVGFGFDPKTSDYKLVRIMERWRYDENDNVLPWDDERQHHLAQVEVYTLGTGSWRKIDAVVPNYNNDSPLVNSYLNGFYYWLLYDGGDAAMYSCDMGDEVFCKRGKDLGVANSFTHHAYVFSEAIPSVVSSFPIHCV
ncbi:hypothetical protein L1049_027674 [Liquidambar formosana]|uniref:F-box associated beta-propeller type 3 domain-containing protein n=1 Tax=Liquidambar formosana TaxID=63359 RepID=A0AAP0RLD6_LIQFO